MGAQLIGIAEERVNALTSELIDGQGSFEFEPTINPPEVEGVDLERRISTSGLIKYFAEKRQLDEADVDPRFVDFLKPAVLEAGLYLPKGKTDRDIDTARGPVIFPADEYKILTRSPIHIANTASTGVKKARQDDVDKESVDFASKRAAGHALTGQIARTNELLDKLKIKESALKLVEKEIFSARGTGYYAHYSIKTMSPLITSAEDAILDALNVVATTGGWTEEQYIEAQKALKYQLFGLHKDRYSYWRGYVPMARRYAHKRRLVVQSTLYPLERTLTKYQSYLEYEE